MITENLSTLKIHKLTQEQYERELAAGTLDANALYLTPEEEIDLSGYATKAEIPEVLEDHLSDLGAITIDLDGSTEGTVAGIDADTFQGYSIDRFVMYSVGGGDGEEDEITVDADKLGGRPAEDYVLKTEISDVLNGITAEKVTMASGLSLEQTLAGCRIDFTDADGNPTDEPYIHWFVDSETGAAVSQGLPNAEEGEF